MRSGGEKLTRSYKAENEEMLRIRELCVQILLISQVDIVISIATHRKGVSGVLHCEQDSLSNIGKIHGR